MRDLAAANPDDPWDKIDLARAFDQRAAPLHYPAAQNQQAHAILEKMQSAGALPQTNGDWIPSFRQTLGPPTTF